MSHNKYSITESKKLIDHNLKSLQTHQPTDARTIISKTKRNIHQNLSANSETNCLNHSVHNLGYSNFQQIFKLLFLYAILRAIDKQNHSSERKSYPKHSQMNPAQKTTKKRPKKIIKKCN